MAICETCDYANRPPYKSPCSECDKTIGSPFCCYEHEEKPTNADRIRAMDDAELAWELMEFRFDGYCKAKGHQTALPDTQQKILEWLKQPVGVVNYPQVSEVVHNESH